MTNKKVAILVANGYEDQEFWYPYLRLKEEGIDLTVVGPEYDVVYKSKHGYPIKSTICRVDASKENWDAVIIPGGNAPDELRTYPEIINLVKKTFDDKGIVASICHGSLLLVSADIVKDKRMTSIKPIKDDIIKAGANWIDMEVVVDSNLVTSRKPMDLPAFMRVVVEMLK